MPVNDLILTAREAAAFLGVAPNTIYTWKHRGALKPVNERGRPRYRLRDVLAAEASRKRKHRRKTGGA